MKETLKSVGVDWKLSLSILGNSGSVVFTLLWTVLFCQALFLILLSSHALFSDSCNPRCAWHELELEREPTLVFLVSTISKHKCYFIPFSTCVFFRKWRNTLLRVCQLKPYCKTFAKLKILTKMHMIPKGPAWLKAVAVFQHENMAYSFCCLFLDSYRHTSGLLLSPDSSFYTANSQQIRARVLCLLFLE